MVTVELSKFKKREPSALLDLREEWCYLLKESKRMGEREGRELSAKGGDMKKAMFRLKELSREEGVRLVEEAKEKARRDQAARERDSFDSGRIEGKAEGMAQGIERGMEKGKMELVVNMLKKGMNISLLSKFTGFSEETIYKLKESQKK